MSTRCQRVAWHFTNLDRGWIEAFFRSTAQPIDFSLSAVRNILHNVFPSSGPIIESWSLSAECILRGTCSSIRDANS